MDRGVRSFKPRAALAEVREQQGDLAGAVREWQSVMKDAPRLRCGWRSLGRLLVRSGQLGEAERLAKHLGRDEALAAEGAILAARLALKSGDAVGSRRLLERAAERWPRDTDVLRELVAVLFEHFDVGEGEPVLLRQLEVDPTDAEAWYHVGIARLLKGRHDKAVAAFRESLKSQPRSAVALLALGKALFASGRADEAVAAWREVLRLAPGHPEATELLKRAA